MWKTINLIFDHMKKALFTLLAGAVVILAGCNKEADKTLEQKLGKTYTITATVENPATRSVASLNEATDRYEFSWDEGEPIAVLPDGEIGVLMFQLAEGSDDTFTYEASGDEPEYTGFGLAVTPFDALQEEEGSDLSYVDGQDVNYYVTLGGSYLQGQSNAVMVAGTPALQADGTQKFSFKHLAALVRVTYENIPTGVLGLEFTTPDHPITGTYHFTSVSDAQIVAGNFPAGETMGQADVFLPEYTEPIASADFYLPIPTGDYHEFNVRLFDDNMETVPGSERTFSTSSPFTVARADVVECPVIEIDDVTITKGAQYTLEQKTGQAFTSLTGDGSSLNVNNMSWTIAKVSGAVNAGIQSNIGARGLQVGSSNNGVKTVTVTGVGYAEYATSQEGGANAYGIKDINIKACAAEGNEVTIGVTVGGQSMSSSDATHTIVGVSYNAVVTSHFTSEELLFGDIVITYSLEEQGALYIHDILINPAPTLANPVVTATSEVSSVTVSWEAIAGAETYDVLLDGDTDYSQEGVTGTSYTFDSVSDGTYTVSVTAKATGYNSGVGTTTVKVKKDGPDQYILVEVAGAFVDGGKYVLAFRDGTNGDYYFMKDGGTTTDNLSSKNALAVSDGIIEEPSDTYIFEATSSDNGFTLKTKNGKYLYNSGSNTNVSINGTNSCVWVPTYLSESGAYKLQNANTTGRYISIGTSIVMKAYVVSSFIDQIAQNKALVQNSGAISVFKLGGIVDNPEPATKLTMSDITCTAHTSSSLTFGWTAVTGAVGYQVSTDGTNFGSTQTGTSYTRTGLNPETDYYIWVKAVGDGVVYSTSDPKKSSVGTTDASSGEPATSTLTFTAACGGSGTADDGVEWTVTSDGSESSFDSTKGIHYGTGSAEVQYIRLTTSDIPGTISKVVVNASTASGVSATVGVTVGGNAFGGNPKTLTTSATNYTFEGSASGEIVVNVSKPEKAAKALYVKSITVTYTAQQ